MEVQAERRQAVSFFGIFTTRLRIGSIYSKSCRVRCALLMEESKNHEGENTFVPGAANIFTIAHHVPCTKHLRD